ncbi:MULTISPECIES: regulatory protein RecX [unclassified Siphonobacter]|uniref:regulatory protein RecX n=1 Tax=unclassified Siphonobacter TaxID=2635712 RepID=UPI00278A6ABC|nr:MULTISPECIES: regulatory protein RecX [unclassified Siphonobacter]MDQ1086740.1 regulatory protein [Siphonobacter sp. SORGH_AS_1065]MDR6197003.1 regulatory protein [Siphonobacter sp. SORGH_AS_0500]
MNKDALLQAAHFCAYQERTVQDVKQKLKSWDVSEDDSEEIIGRLIEDGYLSQERYAQSFARGKFRTRQWGRLKIEQEMRRKGLDSEDRKTGLEQIDEEQYLESLKNLLKKKDASLKDEDPRVRKQKLVRFALGKGYESGLVWKILGEDWE